MASSQIESLVAQLESIETAIEAPVAKLEAQALGGGQASETGFSSAYKLTPEQERVLVDHAIRRLRRLEQDMGRSLVRNASVRNSQSGALSAYDSFLGRRQVFEWMYENNVDWRPNAMGGIFEHSNLVVPLTRRIVRQMIARAQKYFIGTDPWFASIPQGASDRDLAEKVEKYARWKFDKTKLKEAFAMILQMAFVRGECVVKTTFQKKENIFQRNAKVLVDVDGNDILGSDGDVITELDTFRPGVDGVMRLLRDGETELPLVPIYIEKSITRKVVTHNGPTAEPIYYQDFICPLNATSIDDADFCAHLYDAPAMELADFYSKSKQSETPEAEVVRLQAAIESIRLATGGSGLDRSGAKQARTERGETQLSTDETNPKMEIAECYIRYDANDDGVLEEIVLMLDVGNSRALYYDYLANVTPDGRRPFTSVRINPVDGRWYGLGAVEQFKSSQDFVDLTVNRINFAQGASGRVTFWRPDATFEGAANPNLILNTGGTYTLRPGFAASDALTYVNLPETKNNDLNFMLNYFTQIVQLESGVVHGGDQEFSGLPSSKLATGIRSIDQAGSEMFTQYLISLEPSLGQILNRLMTILLDNLDKKEAFTYLEGDALQLLSVTPDDVRGMELNVKLLLTRYHGEQQLQSNAQAANLVAQFYGLPPEVQQKVGLFYRQSLKALGVMESDSIIQPFAPPPLTPEGTTADGRVFGQTGSPGAPTSAVRGARQVPLEAGSPGGSV